MDLDKGKRWFLLLGVALICCAGNAGISQADGYDLKVGQKAPSFEVRSTGGDLFSCERILEERKALVLNFWGLRCGSCIEEIPYINELYKKYGKNISVLGINVDGIDKEILEQQIEKTGLDIAYPVVPDPEMQLVDLYRMNAAPLTVIVGHNGDIVYSHEGFNQGDEYVLEENIRKLIQ